jgi:putative transposase
VSERLPAPLKAVCRVAGVSRSAACEQRRRRRASDDGPSARPLRKRGPVGALGDAELRAAIHQVIDSSPFVGEGHRKVWARLRRRGIRTRASAC